MKLNEKESKVLVYLRNPSYRLNERMKRKPSPVNDLSNEEVLSLYEKMDSVIEYEGELRRSLGSFDEMYRVELAGVKEALLKECKDRGVSLS